MNKNTICAEGLFSSTTPSIGLVRLVQGTQRAAARDQLVNTVSARIRETLELNTILKTAASEIRTALDLNEVIVRLADDYDDV